MKAEKKKQLEAKGWKVGSVEEFLNLSKEESAYIELKLLLSESLAVRRKKRRLNQVELAKLLKSSQSRVAKMEKGDATVSLDLLIRSLLAIGTTKSELAEIISSRPHLSKI
jgi:predicted transcriptional regulator